MGLALLELEPALLELPAIDLDRLYLAPGEVRTARRPMVLETTLGVLLKMKQAGAYTIAQGEALRPRFCRPSMLSHAR
jgi:hypothetical protein